MAFRRHVGPWSFALAALAGPPMLVARVAAPPGATRPPGAAAYETYCAGCHGRGGRGDGPLASQLATRPSDLTTLTRTNDGRFPFERVYGAIDGRRSVKAHGAMPSWGEAFQGSNDAGGAAGVKERITQLTRFVESLQRPEAAPKNRP
jgi:mono/diheme cytochrome c family protein